MAVKLVNSGDQEHFVALVRLDVLSFVPGDDLILNRYNEITVFDEVSKKGTIVLADKLAYDSVYLVILFREKEITGGIFIYPAQLYPPSEFTYMEQDSHTLQGEDLMVICTNNDERKYTGKYISSNSTKKSGYSAEAHVWERYVDGFLPGVKSKYMSRIGLAALILANAGDDRISVVIKDSINVAYSPSDHTVHVAMEVALPYTTEKVDPLVKTSDGNGLMFLLDRKTSKIKTLLDYLDRKSLSPNKTKNAVDLLGEQADKLEALAHSYRLAASLLTAFPISQARQSAYDLGILSQGNNNNNNDITSII